MRRTYLRSLQQMTDPALATKAELDYIPTLNPGEHYPGLIDEAGRPMVAPINTGQNPQFAADYIGNRAEEIRDMMFVNLFQTLVQNPQMTATEALIRQEEKGALLGPSGSIIQAGFAANLERELAILEEKGIYEEGSQFLPPQSLAGRPIRPTFTSAARHPAALGRKPRCRHGGDFAPCSTRRRPWIRRSSTASTATNI